MLKLSCPGAEELGGLLRDVLTDSKASFIVIDAIDECTRAERVILLKDLQKVMKSNSGGVKNFLATRLGIVEEVETTCKTCYYVTMNCPEARSDINTYIEDELANWKEDERLVVRNPGLMNEFQDALVQGANGMLVNPFFSSKSGCLHTQVTLGDFPDWRYLLPSLWQWYSSSHRTPSRSLIRSILSRFSPNQSNWKGKIIQKDLSLGDRCKTADVSWGASRGHCRETSLRSLLVHKGETGSICCY